MKKILEIKSIDKFYGNEKNVIKALNKVELTIFEGEFIAIMGPSGSGKTSLLNMIAMIDEPTNGTILINNKDTSSLKRKQVDEFRAKELGFIFQDFNLISSLTAYDNIALSLSLIGKIKNRQDIKVAAKLLGIEAILNNYPHELSGGQKQRVAIARAIVKNPSLLLCDEPTGSLDSKNAQQLLQFLQLVNQKNNTIIMVTHDTLAASYASKVVFIKDGTIFTTASKNPGMTNDQFRETIITTEKVMRGNSDN